MYCIICNSPTTRRRRTCSEVCLKVALLARPRPPKGPESPYWLGGKKAYKQRYPERRKAHLLVRKACQRGLLTRQPCQECGEAKSEAHHEDYSKPLEVIWLCRAHHTEADRKLGWGPAANAHLQGLKPAPQPGPPCKVCGTPTIKYKKSSIYRATCSEDCLTENARSWQAEHQGSGPEHPLWQGGEKARRRRLRERKRQERTSLPQDPTTCFPLPPLVPTPGLPIG